MKKFVVMSFLVFSGAANAKEIPSSFWFTLSEKILAETQGLFSSESKEPVKVVIKKKAVTKVKPQLSCDQDENHFPISFPAIKRGTGIWMITE